MFLFLRQRAGVLLAFALTALTGCIDEDRLVSSRAGSPKHVK
jgi:hypothetical protein